MRGRSSRGSAPAAPTSGGAGSVILGGVAAAGDTLWVAGDYDTGGNRLTLLERHQES